MKIDFYISSLSGGGAEKVLISIATKCQELGNDVSIISLEKRPQFYKVNERVKVYKFNNRRGIKDFFDIRKQLKRSNADVSICFLSRCNLLVLLASIFNKRKIIVCDRNNPLKEHSKIAFLISNMIYKRANKIIVQTKEIRKLYSKKIQNKIEVIENPIDIVGLEKQVKNENLEREKTVISVGRLEKQKDYKTLIKAFEKIHIKFPDWKLKIFGIGNMDKELQEYIDQLKLNKCVKLCGRTESPYYEMRKAHIFVLSSFYEGFPNVLCEAMYAEDLCVSSDCVSGPKELIDNKKNGWLFPVGDQKKLTEILLSLIENIEKGNGLDEIRNAARKTVSRLEISKNIAKWNYIIENVNME